jgi:large subunit ribosomal protein L44e
VFKKKAKNTKKIVLKLECQQSKAKTYKVIKRCKTFILGKKEVTKGQVMFCAI